MPSTIGEAYLQIRPSMEGIQGEIEEALGDSGRSGARSFGSAFSTGLAAVSGAAVAAVGAASAGVASLTSQATSSFAQYEQLVGGVETLFGDSAETVIQNASAAFNSAGMSMNDYMETSIQSAAALINSLEGNQAQAADLMDMSITDMADNVNRMGTTMEAVQNAYRGFSRGNFTMLDNLALGFAGTKEGMQELLDKAQEISGIEYDIDSYSDIVTAIHVVQEEMGITGTTAAEAADTVSGSMSSVRSAFQNLVGGLANPDADLGALIDNVVNTGTQALNNMAPVVMNALQGIAKAIPQIVPIITAQFPVMIQTLLPPLIDAIVSLVTALVGALPDILGILIDVLPSLFNVVIETIISMLPLIIDLGLQLIMALASGLIDALPTLIPALVDVILTIVDKLTNPDTIVQLVQAALQIMIALAEGLIKALPRLIEKAPTIVMNLVEAIIKAAPELLKAALELILTIAAGIVDSLDGLIQKGAEIVDSVKEGFFQKVEEAKSWGKDMIQNFIDGILAKWENLKSTVTDLAGTIKSLLGFSEPENGPLSNFHTFAPDMMELFANGIKDNLGLITNAMGDVTGVIAADFTPSELVPSYSGIAEVETKNIQSVENPGNGGDWVFPIYIGQERLDTIILNAQQRHNLVSGGR